MDTNFECRECKTPIGEALAIRTNEYYGDPLCIECGVKRGQEVQKEYDQKRMINLDDALELKKKKNIPTELMVIKIKRYCIKCNIHFLIRNKLYGEIVACPECGKEYVLRQEIKIRAVIEAV
jgi:predicted RNA-binding Zn-ribbon protein involved in translation (DUF1610 family)